MIWSLAEHPGKLWHARRRQSHQAICGFKPRMRWHMNIPPYSGSATIEQRPAITCSKCDKDLVTYGHSC